MPKLISNWKKSHKLTSMQILAIAAAVEAINEVISDVIPRWISLALILGAMMARLVVQESMTK